MNYAKKIVLLLNSNIISFSINYITSNFIKYNFNINPSNLRIEYANKFK